MTRKRNLNKGTFKRFKKKQAALAVQTPLSSTAVERGTTRWLDGSRVDIEGILNLIGTGNMTGTWNGSGVTNLSGTNNLSGDNNLTGPTEVSGSLDVTGPTKLNGVLDIGGDTTITGQLDVTGPTALDGKLTITGDTSITGILDVTGPTAIKGTLGIEGVTTLKNDLNVTSGGKINAGNLQIEPANGGQINFTGGSLASSPTFGALLNNSIAVRIEAPSVQLNTTDVNIASLPSKPASELTPVGIDANGRLHRIQ